MTSLHLLPEADEALRCADHARRIGTDPGGTAIRADRVVLVVTPQPWPKPALAHPLLAPLAERLSEGAVPTRLLAAVPTASLGPGQVVVYDRTATGTIERRFVVDPTDPAAMAALADRFSDDADGTVEDAGPAIAICVQGSHDVCCGSDGTRLALQVEEAVATGRAGFVDLTVFRVSHTGGHRFAPTAMTLPSGRMWADLDLDAVATILARAGEPAALVDRCRGWWGAATGAPQVAERAVFAARGWDLDDADRSVLLASSDDGADTFEITIGADERWRVTVTPGREVPTIACGQPGGQPAKPAREYDVTAIARA